MNRANGFSLIEVLIALIILAIAFLAIMETTQSNIRSSIHVKDTLTADWVALNLLSSIQAQLIQAPNPGSSKTGTSTMLNQQWRWTVKSDRTGSDTYSRVTITVSRGKKQIQSLIGFAPLAPSI